MTSQDLSTRARRANTTPRVAARLTRPAALRRGLELTRYLVALGSVISLVMCVAGALGWAGIKPRALLQAMTSTSGSSENALVYLFESIDTVVDGVVLLQVGLGSWELCVGNVVLPDSLATHVR